MDTIYFFDVFFLRSKNAAKLRKFFCNKTNYSLIKTKMGKQKLTHLLLE